MSIVGSNGLVFAFVSAVALVVSCQPSGTPTCGDGIVDADEACDDGNTLSGDGCSATCALEDNASTPGDDRAGYLTCSDAATGASITCGPGTGCCGSSLNGPQCETGAAACPAPYNFQACDGPEDCPAGQACTTDDRATQCRPPGSPFIDRCHTDVDCKRPGQACFGGLCKLPSACGNGQLDPVEECDDGNTVGGDGCSSTCMRDDIVSTPGDERAGYVACTDPATQASISCGPGSGCCSSSRTGPACAATPTDCTVPYGFASCDGPEDCPGAQVCATDGRTFDCRDEGTGYSERCHADFNCQGGQVCVNGLCTVRLCGNGQLDPGEQCDDGNIFGGDGCAADCTLDDVESTPGDDRAGYVSCTDVPHNATVDCGPGYGCCVNGPLCATDLTGCVTPFDFVACDGPEDCAPGEFCSIEPHGTSCQTGPRPYYAACHTAADCAGASTPSGDLVNPVCDGGTCMEGSAG